MKKCVIFVIAFALLVYADSYAQGQGRDRDNNPPGPRGGPGTNWENPPGPKGGPGAGPDQRQRGGAPATAGGTQTAVTVSPVGVVDSGLEEKAVVSESWERKADTNGDGVVDQVEVDQWRKARSDRDNNPPGPRGGPGTNWENPPGPQGGSGAGPDRRQQIDRDNNPPGPRGGKGTNWENPPGPKGGRGASPDRKR